MGTGGDRLTADLGRLGQADLSTLRRRWRAVFGKVPPDHMPRWLLGRALAYRVQAVALGDLDRAVARQLDRMGEGGVAVIPLPEDPIAKPGTLLVREWEGSLQRVMVLEDGFAWDGRTFDSLSAVAGAITGTKWNGPRFFGLRAAGKGRLAA